MTWRQMAEENLQAAEALFREDADYRPALAIDERTARDCVRLSAEVLQML